VLRAKVGQEYEIAANGVVRLGTVRSITGDRVEFELGTEIGNRPFPNEGKDRAPIRSEDRAPTASEDRAPITLLLAIFKFDRFEWAVEKATELGVATVVPVIARRTDAHLAQAATKRVERWRRIAHEASQQSRRNAPPEIGDPVKLKDAVSLDSGLKMLLAETEEQRTLREALEASRSRVTGVHNRERDVVTQPGMAVPHRSVALAVGPEGGWAEDEVQLFKAKGWTAVSLGPTILRAETAVVAAIAVTQSLLL
jgi:16S rRNA (uracil1498-N3)-methyltransferase